ncbi:MAG TPA: Rho termination factor N-terminal domain-containing protein [Solirubrobacteraceae bacterium]|jgi:transcription termination factor Rho|nr:Rho termination factor N-terminal domain-containing protein [Solirubrobacteraceae bacterium]
MSVLDRSGLEESPLADLHAIASELAIDGYRRLRRADLIDSILAHQAGEEPATATAAAVAEAAEEAPKDEQPASRRRRGRRGGRARAGGREDGDAAPDEAQGDDEGTPAAAESERAKEESTPPAEPAVVEGVVELLPNGSGFLRVSPPGPSDDDVYISAAQVKRCELLSGDVISGPPRAPRRSERFPSLIRVDTINSRPAGEAAEGSRFDDLPATFPDERIPLGSEDPTVKAIEWLTPFGKGSRVSIVGPSRAGKTEALRRLAGPLAEHPELQISVVLAGVRPEEIGDWTEGLQPVAAVSFAVSPDVQAHVIEPVVDTARRLATRGSDVVLLIDTLDGLAPLAARKTLAAARNIVDGGSLTVIATATEPVGGETTVIALDAALASTGRFPAIDLLASGTIRPERLVGEAAAEAIGRARMEAAEDS